ncbi:hypothetical protein SRRS_49980 [Sporomusa rhizae]|uniref:hypothetical protein n=1 Tax=Sporomusa rhizae TaxID=357999 RepID=UPI00352A222E
MQDLFNEVTELLGEFSEQNLLDFKQNLISPLTHWIASGKPVPPPDIYKHQTIKWYGERFDLDTLIETGTYLGTTVWSVRNYFRRIISIELGQDLYERAKKLFESLEHVSIIKGDSGKVLPIVLDFIDKPCLFWLDGHYSEGITACGDIQTPIIQEIEAVFAHPVKQHVILIDDARLFVGKDDYPKLDEFIQHVKRINNNVNVEVVDDIIRITLDKGMA